MTAKHFFHTVIDNQYISSLGFTLYKVGIFHYVGLQFNIAVPFPAWTAVEIARINGYDGQEGSIIATDIGSDSSAFLIVIDHDGKVTAQSHRAINSYAWFYGSGIF